MFSLEGSSVKNTAELIKLINELVSFYGFEDFDTFLKEQEIKHGKRPKMLNVKSEPKTLHVYEKDFVALSKFFIRQAAFQRNSGMRQLYSYEDLSKARGAFVKYFLHIIGEEDSFAEAFLVYIVELLSKRIFNKNIVVEVNSLGDKDSVVKYLVDIKRYLRRNKKSLPPMVLAEYEKDNIDKALSKLIQSKHPLTEGLPNIMDYLGDVAQKHLYSFLNYLDNFDLAYELNPNLFASADVWKHLLFNIYTYENGRKVLVAQGGRYDNAVLNIFGVEKSFVSVMLYLERKGRKQKVSPGKVTKKSKVYFVQLGHMAKTQGGKILEEILDAGFNVGHSIAELSLLEQYKLAIDFGARYAVILGHKEAIDGTVIIRDIETQTQEIIEQKDLIKKLKKLK